jgi:hypothetical protein
MEWLNSALRNWRRLTGRTPGWLVAAQRSKWIVAALTLVTLPAAIFLSPKSATETTQRLFVYLGMLPLFAAVAVEMLGMLFRSESIKVASKIGNQIAAFLALVLFAAILWGIYVVLARSH